MSTYVGGISHLGFRFARNKSLLFYDDCLVVSYTSSWWMVPIRIFRYTLFNPVIVPGVARAITKRELEQMRDFGHLGPDGIRAERPAAVVISLADVDHAVLDITDRRRCRLTLHRTDDNEETLWWYTARRDRPTLMTIVQRSLKDKLHVHVDLAR